MHALHLERSANRADGGSRQSTGSDGATYRLADGAYVQVLRGDFNDTFSLDGDTAAVSFEVPVGSYSVYIGNYFGALDLLRIASDGTPELVSAQLLTPLPLTVDVVANATSNVAFQLRVNSGGTVTFGQGSIDVEINVDARDVLGGRALTIDGETLDLGALEGSAGGLSGTVYQSVYRDDGTSVLQAAYSGPVAFTFRPE